jgi:hypothetical protein
VRTHDRQRCDIPWAGIGNDLTRGSIYFPHFDRYVVAVPLGPAAIALRMPWQAAMPCPSTLEVAMRIWSLPALVAVALLGTASVTLAQTPSAVMYENCRDQAIAQNLTGEARGTAIGQCMSTATANPEAGKTQAVYEACREDAVARSLTGEVRANAVNECVTVATITPAAGKSYSLESCRSGAIARGLSGDALNQFIDRCTKGQ